MWERDFNQFLYVFCFFEITSAFAFRLLALIQLMSLKPKFFMETIQTSIRKKLKFNYYYCFWMNLKNSNNVKKFFQHFSKSNQFLNKKKYTLRSNIIRNAKPKKYYYLLNILFIKNIDIRAIVQKLVSWQLSWNCNEVGRLGN